MRLTLKYFASLRETLGPGGALDCVRSHARNAPAVGSPSATHSSVPPGPSASRSEAK